MSHDGEGRHAAASGTAGHPGLMTYGTSAPGEVLAERYRLEEHVDTDSAGRQIWRGLDMLLRRPVALVLRWPGGEAAAGMLTTAVASSRLVHPHLVSVYDAIDERHRAYLVREWVPGVALRDVLRQSPLDSERSVLVTHAVAEAVAALHAAGIAHGNIHPGTILVADDGRVVLTDAHSDAPADPSSDIRALGALLYACLTSRWPYAEAGHATLPDAARDPAGRLVPLRQVRGSIPRHLDEIATDLLDRRVPPPPAAVIAAEFARLANADGEPEYDDPRGPMGFASTEGGPRRWAVGKLALGVAVLTAIAVAGAFMGVRVFSAATNRGTGAPGAGGSPASLAVGKAQPIAVTAGQVRVVDPPQGDRQELVGYERVVDGNETTGWSTDKYNRANFGGLKPGMGLLINLGAPTMVGAVRVVVSQQGASIALRTGSSDPGDTAEGDKTIASDYVAVGTPLEDHSGTVMVFPVPEEQQSMQYLLIWITKLPANSEGKYVLAINEITVLSP